MLRLSLNVSGVRLSRFSLKAVVCLAMACGCGRLEAAEGTPRIVIDGEFADWDGVPPHSDPVGGPGVLHDGIPDTHDTDHSGPVDVPEFVDHPDIDLVEYRFTHDEGNLYAYFRATGQIGHTISTATQRGRYYVIVTLDVDHNDQTGYALHEGGYYPTSVGYDMNMEVEFYDGSFNTGHYLNHGARDSIELEAALEDQKQGVVRVQPGSYDYYSQWVWFDDPVSGDVRLPSPDDFASITFVADKGPVYQGIVEMALSPDGHEGEMCAPFRGFMRDESGHPIIDLGMTIDVSFSLEASGELAPGRSWASDTGNPIVGYELSPVFQPKLEISPGSSQNRLVVSWDNAPSGASLQHASDLVDADWRVVPGSGQTNRVTVTVQEGAEFFRLVAP